MTQDAYTALADFAFKRIEQDWICTDAERAVLILVNELSFVLGQSFALIPCLADFAAATGLHKSTISRAVRSALKKRYLQILKRGDEILYSLWTETPANAPSMEGAEESKESAMQRLVKLNEERLQGKSDGNGQQRLPGIFESEETGAPAAAFAAMMAQEDPTLSSAPAPAAQRPQSLSTAPTAQDVEERLSRLSQGMEEARERQETVSTPRPVASVVTASSKREVEWEEASRGLKGDSLYALECIRSEAASAGERGLAEFFQWRFSWRKRVVSNPLLWAESAGVHKSMRLEGKPARSPGAFIYSTGKTALRLKNETS